MPDFQIDSNVENSNITQHPHGWADRIVALLERFFGQSNPFNSAALVETGTSEGNSILTGENGSVPSSVLPDGLDSDGVQSFVPVIEERGTGQYANNVEYFETYSRRRRTITCRFIVYKESDIQAPHREPTESEIIGLSGLPVVVRVGAGETESFTINTGASIDSFTVEDVDSDARVEITGSGSSWTINVTGVNAGEWSPANFVATRGDMTERRFMRIEIPAVQATPGVVPRATGLNEDHTLQSGQTITDEFTVFPSDATVSIEQSPDPGYVSVGGPTKVRDNLWRIIYTGVAPLSTPARRAVIQVNNGDMNTRYFVTLDVLGSRSGDDGGFI